MTTTVLTTTRDIFIVTVTNPARPRWDRLIERRVFLTHLVARHWGQQQLARYDGQVRVDIHRGLETVPA
jgi:hypothetical protein